MYTLFICEKPSQAKDLARNLNATVSKKGWYETSNAEVKVTWCVGHLLELCPPEAYSSDYKIWSISKLPIIPAEFHYTVNEKTKDQYKTVTSLLNRCSSVVISTDFDREGEAIARNIISEVNYTGSIKRLKLTALDDKSIQTALANILPGESTEALFRAAQARAWADWLVGMNLSRLYTCINKDSLMIHNVISIGRVQTPTLALVVQRDYEIEHFVSVPFYELFLRLQANDMVYSVKWIPSDKYLNTAGYVTDREQVQKLANQLNGTTAKVSSYKAEIKKSAAPLLFDLTSLQKAANRLWGYAASKTLDIVQQLYEKYKATSYPRTDCRYLPESQHDAASKIIANICGFLPELQQFSADIDYNRQHQCFNTNKVTAHHAIIPTENSKVDIQGMTSDVLNVYRLICKSYLAAFMPPLIQNVVRIELNAAEELFRATGKSVIDMGWSAVFFDEKRKDKEETSENPGNNEFTVTEPIPVSQVGDIHQINETKIEDKKTQPPQRYTENTLLGAMENISRYVTEEKWKKILKETSGLGTPATRAGIIDNLLARGYVERKGKSLISTDFGKSVINMIPDNIKNAGMTAVWEQALDSLAQNSPKMSIDRFMSSIKSWISTVIREVSANHQSIVQKELKIAELRNGSEFLCPKCNKKLEYREGKFGAFWSCSGCKSTYKDNKGTPDLTSSNQKLTEIKCPLCQAPMVLRKSPKGMFYGCSKFPKCKGTAKLPITDTSEAADLNKAAASQRKNP